MRIRNKLSVTPLILSFLISIVICFSDTASAEEQPKVLRCGWYHWDPYQYTVEKDDVKHLTGLDVQLVRAICERMGYQVLYDEVSWKNHQIDIKEGRRDIAAGAFQNAERASYAYYSLPYRMETDVLYVRLADASSFRFQDSGDLIRQFSQHSTRLGVVEGFYYGPTVQGYIEDPINAARIVNVKNDFSNFQNLLSHKIDAFICDRLVGGTLAWRYGWQLDVAEISPPVFEATIHVIFSKKTMTPQLVNAFNHSLDQLRRSGRYGQIVSEYLLPVLISATAGRRWFFILDIIGTIAFAVSGVLLARLGRYSFFGAFVLASLPAVGGGIMRDVIVNRETPAVLTTPAYLLAILFTVTICYVLFKIKAWWDGSVDSRSEHPSEKMVIGSISNNSAVAFFDAIGLSAFTVIGVIVAMEARCHPLWLWGSLLAALTGAGGGIIRDVIRADADNPGLKGSFYAEVALIWGLILSLFMTFYANSLVYQPSHITLMVVVVLLGGLITRMTVFYFRIRSPMF